MERDRYFTGEEARVRARRPRDRRPRGDRVTPWGSGASRSAPNGGGAPRSARGGSGTRRRPGSPRTTASSSARPPGVAGAGRVLAGRHRAPPCRWSPAVGRALTIPGRLRTDPSTRSARRGGLRGGRGRRGEQRPLPHRDAPLGRGARGPRPGPPLLRRGGPPGHQRLLGAGRVPVRPAAGLAALRLRRHPHRARPARADAPRGRPRVMELARGDGSVSTFHGVHSGLAMNAIAMLGSEEQKERWLRRWRGSSDRRLRAHRARPRLGRRRLETRARHLGDGYVLDGEKRWIGNAVFADLMVVWARDAQGEVGAYVVEKGTPGFEATPDHRQDRQARLVAGRRRADRRPRPRGEPASPARAPSTTPRAC